MGFLTVLLSKAVNTAVSSITGDGLISGLVGIGSGLLSSKGASDANAANAEQADINRSFQERMRATQYQTAVGDLKAAGLNPMLAYTNGGAGNLSGATATMQDTLTPVLTLVWLLGVTLPRLSNCVLCVKRLMQMRRCPRLTLWLPLLLFR